jgi:peptidyl-prolyl cis-trans isomerase SurA
MNTALPSFSRIRRSTVQRKISMWGFFLLAMASSHAQVASHAPTAFKPSSAHGPARPVAKVVARVNGSVLTDADLLREEYAIFPYARQHNGIPPDLAPQIRDGAMKMIVFEELVYQEARHRNMTIPAAKLQSAQADFRKQFSTPEEFNTFVQSECQGSQQALAEKIRRSLLIDTLLKKEIESKSTVSPAEVKVYYDKTPARFQHPESFRFQSISILPPAKATAEQLKEGRTRAENALRQAKATKTAEEFGLLAEKVSDDDFRVMMGQHKPVPASELPPSVVKTMAAMKVGEVSDLLQVEQAYTIVRLQEHAPAGKAKFEEVKDQLAKDLQQNKTNELRSALDKKLREHARIEEM